MNDDTLIRLENLRALGKRPVDLVEQVGNSKQYWGDLLKGRKSFGERIARKIEERLGLPRGSLDQPSSPNGLGGETRMSQTVTGSKMLPPPLTELSEIPVAMPYSAPNLKSAILLMGSLLGALDTRSKSIIGDMLKDLATHTDDAEDIANKASALATVQQKIVDDPDLDKAIKGRRPAETSHGALR